MKYAILEIGGLYVVNIVNKGGTYNLSYTYDCKYALRFMDKDVLDRLLAYMNVHHKLGEKLNKIYSNVDFKQPNTDYGVYSPISHDIDHDKLNSVLRYIYSCNYDTYVPRRERTTLKTKKGFIRFVEDIT